MGAQENKGREVGVHKKVGSGRKGNNYATIKT